MRSDTQVPIRVRRRGVTHHQLEPVASIPKRQRSVVRAQQQHRPDPKVFPLASTSTRASHRRESLYAHPIATPRGRPLLRPNTEYSHRGAGRSCRDPRKRHRDGDHPRVGKPARRPNRDPHIAYDDTPIEAEHHRAVVGRHRPRTTSPRSVALAAPAITTHRVRQQLRRHMALALKWFGRGYFRTSRKSLVIGGFGVLLDLRWSELT